MIETPQAHHPDQALMWSEPVETSFATLDDPLALHIKVTFNRRPRQKCSRCGHRRVCYFFGVGDAYIGPIMCAKCSGIR